MTEEPFLGSTYDGEKRSGIDDVMFPFVFLLALPFLQATGNLTNDADVLFNKQFACRCFCLFTCSMI